MLKNRANSLLASLPLFTKSGITFDSDYEMVWPEMDLKAKIIDSYPVIHIGVTNIDRPFKRTHHAKTC